MDHTDNNNGVPEVIMDKLYEFTNNGQYGGFILAYVDNSGSVSINCKVGSQVVELGLRKSLEKFLDQIELSETTMPQQDPDELE
jgi:hypothetical protein|tara:strand:- start:2308 stop:2559 length:252 start_codon:yes stop_codon:yes gene_type:complete